MIEIIAHRGYWQKTSEKNTFGAFERAFSLNFGVETDIRDYRNELVISHDIPSSRCLKLESFFSLYRDYRQKSALALNIKSDGLREQLRAALKKFGIKNYFVFDMSFPEQLLYTRAGFNVFARQSEYERSPLLYKDAKGVWLDEFDSRWIKAANIAGHARKNKKVCIVSPELHGRDHRAAWNQYRLLSKKIADKVTLCTDLPLKAREFFNEKN